ncbi:type II 3-dehydroquinate dehydratase [uncultured Cohaesibacter sp.]|uniref:type II 3-dehydroquinate dehydratase n=1 Tax=uncultured Cohaesibacter sp. TaxID=1002546 RepID=UPI0029C662B1|nr:type II 3-dehydroquinate dehydratase [uncultured Cohaesibacter sp.]
MTNTLYVLNGPNLNMLGLREPGIYGATTLKDIEEMCKEKAASMGWSIVFRQSNHEGELIDWIHEAREKSSGIIFNPAAFTHTSVALQDAIRAVSMPLIEVHLSNIHARESFRHHSYVSPAALGVICGLNAKGYVLAIEALVDHLESA